MMTTAGTTGFREATFEGAPRFVELRLVEIGNMSRTYGPPPAPSSVAAGVPDELDRLCLAMLDPDPARRPAAREVLQVLEGRP